MCLALRKTERLMNQSIDIQLYCPYHEPCEKPLKRLHVIAITLYIEASISVYQTIHGVEPACKNFL